MSSEFTWQAPADRNGFILGEWSDPHQPKLGRFPGIVTRPGAAFRTYSPLREETGLFRTFAELSPAPEAFLEFANHYGYVEGREGLMGAYSIALLSGSKAPEMFSMASLINDLSAAPPNEGEPLYVWREMVRWLRRRVSLWDMIQSENREQLAEIVRWEAGGVRVLALDEAEREVFWPFSDWAWGSENRVSPGDVVLPALRFLHTSLNYVLGSVTPTLVWDPETKASVIRTLPKSLWGAMCLQFAEAVGANKKYQKCPVCGRWFELSPGVNRANKQFCSGACRTRATRQRQEEALRLHAAGKSAREIAREIETEVETVKKWVAKKKEK